MPIANQGTDVPLDASLPERLQHVSPTQLKTFKECERKWAFQKLRRISVPQTKAMGLGSDVHKEQELWVATGQLRPEHSRPAAIFANAAPLWPEWGSDLRGETNIATSYPTRLAGVPFVGFIDLECPARGDETETLPLVGDLKTTKDLFYVKTAKELSGDPQVIGYGRWLARKTYGEDLFEAPSGVRADKPIVQVRFVYALTQYPRGSTPATFGGESARAVNLELSINDMTAPWDGFARDVERMTYLARNHESLSDSDFKPNWASCDAWGGCPHRARCGELTAQNLVQIRPRKEETAVANDLSSMFEGMDSVDASVPDAPERAVVMGVGGPMGTVTTRQAPSGFELYIDCVPVIGAPSGRVVQLEDYLELGPVRRVLAEWNEAHGVVLQDIQQIDFGKWKGPLKAAIREEPPNGRVLLARGMGDLATVALEALRPLARLVVQGVR